MLIRRKRTTGELAYCRCFSPTPAPLATLARAILAVRADEHARHPKSDGLIPPTCSQIQHLFFALVGRPVHGTAHRVDWSHWRSRHQPRSQASHYRRQAAQT